MIDELAARARRALGHKQLRHLMALVPAEDRANPRALVEWLTTAAAHDPNGARGEGYKQAYAAVHKWREAQAIADKVARLYHDPRIRAAAGDKLDWYWEHPTEAIKALHDLADSNPGLLGERLLDDALDAAYAAREFATGNGVQEPSAEKPIPTDPTGRETEISQLLDKSVTKGLTKEENVRLDHLYADRVAAEMAAEERQASAPAASKADPSEWQRLIDKSLDGTLTPAENARLNDLAHARAVNDGLIEADDYGDDYSDSDNDGGYGGDDSDSERGGTGDG